MRSLPALPLKQESLRNIETASAESSDTTGAGCQHATGLTGATVLTNFLALIRPDL